MEPLIPALNTREAARLIGCTPANIRVLVARGLLQCLRPKHRSHIQFYSDQVEANPRGHGEQDAPPHYTMEG